VLDSGSGIEPIHAVKNTEMHAVNYASRPNQAAGLWNLPSTTSARGIDYVAHLFDRTKPKSATGLA